MGLPAFSIQRFDLRVYAAGNKDKYCAADSQSRGAVNVQALNETANTLRRKVQCGLAKDRPIIDVHVRSFAQSPSPVALRHTAPRYAFASGTDTP